MRRKQKAILGMAALSVATISSCKKNDLQSGAKSDAPAGAAGSLATGDLTRCDARLAYRFLRFGSDKAKTYWQKYGRESAEMTAYLATHKAHASIAEAEQILGQSPATVARSIINVGRAIVMDNLKDGRSADDIASVYCKLKDEGITAAEVRAIARAKGASIRKTRKVLQTLAFLGDSAELKAWRASAQAGLNLDTPEFFDNSGYNGCDVEVLHKAFAAKYPTSDAAAAWIEGAYSGTAAGADKIESMLEQARAQLRNQGASPAAVCTVNDYRGPSAERRQIVAGIYFLFNNDKAAANAFISEAAFNGERELLYDKMLLAQSFQDQSKVSKLSHLSGKSLTTGKLKSKHDKQAIGAFYASSYTAADAKLMKVYWSKVQPNAAGKAAPKTKMGKYILGSKAQHKSYKALDDKLKSAREFVSDNKAPPSQFFKSSYTAADAEKALAFWKKQGSPIDNLKDAKATLSAYAFQGLGWYIDQVILA